MLANWALLNIIGTWRWIRIASDLHERDLKALCHAIRADCLLMKQLGPTCLRDKFEFAIARHHLFKCIQCCIFEFSIYVGFDVLIVSLQSVSYCLPTPLVVLLHCWMRNSIASVSERMIQLAVSFTSSPCITSDLEPLPMVIFTLLPSAEIGGPLVLALETVDILNVRAKNLSQHVR